MRLYYDFLTIIGIAIFQIFILILAGGLISRPRSCLFVLSCKARLRKALVPRSFYPADFALLRLERKASLSESTYINRRIPSSFFLLPSFIKREGLLVLVARGQQLAHLYDAIQFPQPSLLSSPEVRVFDEK
jgi:hypothetical protein